MSKICSIDGCNTNIIARGVCSKHYQQVYKSGAIDTLPFDRIIGSTHCVIDGCNNITSARNMCTIHYSKAYRDGEFEPRQIRKRKKGPQRLCSINGCSENHFAKGFCYNHYQNERCKQGLEFLKEHGNEEREIVSRWTNPYGYVVLAFRDNGPHQKEHRYLMEQKLGRKLLSNENVHHINGVRDDNRPENLELWVSTQPSGQRAEDLVKWAYEIIERYTVKPEK